MARILPQASIQVRLTACGLLRDWLSPLIDQTQVLDPHSRLLGVYGTQWIASWKNLYAL
jgi:hypothetical protein